MASNLESHRSSKPCSRFVSAAACAYSPHSKSRVTRQFQHSRWTHGVQCWRESEYYYLCNTGSSIPGTQLYEGDGEAAGTLVNFTSMGILQAAGNQRYFHESFKKRVRKQAEDWKLSQIQNLILYLELSYHLHMQISLTKRNWVKRWRSFMSLNNLRNLSVSWKSALDLLMKKIQPGMGW